MGRRIGFVGHIDSDSDAIGGQTIRTRLTLVEIQQEFQDDVMEVIDTEWLKSRPLWFCWRLLYVVTFCDVVVVMPGPRFVKYLFPLISFIGRIKKNLLVVAVGGWITDYSYAYRRVRMSLMATKHVFVQTSRMRDHLIDQGITHVSHLPNYKRFHPLLESVVVEGDKLRLVYMSRITPTKGIATVLEACELLQNVQKGTGVVLDVWGPIQPGCEEWFLGLCETYGDYFEYRGVCDSEDVQSVLSEYDILVFPSYYPGEGFPGAVLDAYIAGIPVIAADWLDIKEVVEHGRTGLLFAPGDSSGLSQLLQLVATDRDLLANMRKQAANEAARYHVDRVLPVLMDSISAPN